MCHGWENSARRSLRSSHHIWRGKKKKKLGPSLQTGSWFWLDKSFFTLEANYSSAIVPWWVGGGWMEKEKITPNSTPHRNPSSMLLSGLFCFMTMKLFPFIAHKQLQLYCLCFSASWSKKINWHLRLHLGVNCVHSSRVSELEGGKEVNAEEGGADRRDEIVCASSCLFSSLIFLFFLPSLLWRAETETVHFQKYIK